MADWLIIQYDNRPLDRSHKFLQRQTKHYCKKHNYDYIFINKEYDLPPWWIKVKLVQEHLHSYKGVLWLDADAVISDDSILLENLVSKEHSFYCAPDAPLWNGVFNAGVWLVLNNSVGNKIMNEWLKLYEPKVWSFSNNKWTTKGNWAGPSYEQGAFIDNILPKYRASIKVFPWYIFQSYRYTDCAFIMHFAGKPVRRNMTGYEIRNTLKRYLPAYIRKTRRSPVKTVKTVA